MRKQATGDFTAINANQNQFKESRKNLPVINNPRYIYTEEDLGEGILDVGVISPYSTGRLDPQPWTSMLKTNWA